MTQILYFTTLLRHLRCINKETAAVQYNEVVFYV